MAVTTDIESRAEVKILRKVSRLKHPRASTTDDVECMYVYVQYYEGFTWKKFHTQTGAVWIEKILWWILQTNGSRLIIILHHMIGFMTVHDQDLTNQRNQNKTHGIKEFLAKSTLVFLHLVEWACLQLEPFLLRWNFTIYLWSYHPPPNTTRYVALVDYACVSPSSNQSYTV